MTEGDTAWTIGATGTDAVPPYKVTLEKHVSHTGEFAIFVNSAGTRFFLPKDLFPTEAEAWLAYRDAMYARLNHLGNQITDAIEWIREAENRIAELTPTEAPK